jgi:hypothetical protein
MSSWRTLLAEVASSALKRDAIPWWLRIILTLWVVFVFGLPDILILLKSQWAHLYGTVGVSIQRWEEVVLYLPFGQAFSLNLNRAEGPH